MRLYLVQHGEAETEEQDPERPLTDQGVADVRQVARLIAGGGDMSVGRIYHSGKRRARQSAEIWGGVLGVAVEEADGLAPLDDPAVWAGRVGGVEEDVMLVGHMPHLGKLVGLLVAGDAERAIVAFRPGAVVGLERGPDGWSVVLALRPDVVAG